MKRIFNFTFLFVVVFFLICGCVGKTKPSIPDGIPQIENGKARIVLTREKQISGAGSPMIVIDIGKNIEPNSMMYIKNNQFEDILSRENIFSWPGVPVDFMWFNPKMVKPLYCSINEPGCIKYHWRWPKDWSNGFLFGNIALISPNCKIYHSVRGLFPVKTKWDNCPEQISYDIDAIWKNEIEFIDIAKDLKCGETFTSFPGEDKQGFKASCRNHHAFVFTSTPQSKSAIRLEGGSPYLSLTYGGYKNIIDNRKINRNVQVIGSVEVGDTLVWDRKPGIIRLGSVWWDGVGFMPKNIEVEAGKTYFLRYKTRMGQRWELEKVE